MKAFVLIAAVVLLVPLSASGQCLTTFQTEVLPAFFVGQPANFQIEAVSGTPPYRFEIVEGELPEGLHLTPNGRIRGVPTMEQETTIFVRLTDAEGCGLVQAFPVSVLPAD